MSVNVPPVKRMQLENWLWTQKKIRIDAVFRTSQDVDRFLSSLDEFKKDTP
jgi:hypothetical protein